MVRDAASWPAASTSAAHLPQLQSGTERRERGGRARHSDNDGCGCAPPAAGDSEAAAAQGVKPSCRGGRLHSQRGRYGSDRSKANCEGGAAAWGGQVLRRLAALMFLAALLQLHRPAQAIPIDNSLVDAEIKLVCSNSSAVDLVFIMDGSGSVGDPSFEQQKTFVTRVIDQLNIGTELINVAVVQFADEARLEIGLTDHMDRRNLNWAIAKIRYLSGTTQTGQALQFALDMVLSRSTRDVPKVAVVLTDGQSQDSVIQSANALRDSEVLVYAVGVTNLVDLNELYQITGTPTRVFTVRSFDVLDGTLAKAIVAEMCKYDFKPGTADIVCEADQIGVRASTKRPFEGHIFVKGHFHDPECRLDAGAFSNPTRVGMQVPFANCDVRRWRSLTPRGIYVETTIIFMFHPLFMTKVDQSIKVQCFYMEADKTVSVPLEVSMITTEFRDQIYPMPTCTYSIHAGNENGPLVQFAQIGMQVWHVWRCVELDPEKDTFGMRVHSCFVDDGSGDRVDLIDPNGCTLDKRLVGTPDYDSTLRVAVKEAHVFKYADRPVLQFQCQITVCIKYDGDCDDVTPPKCDDSIPRARRSLDYSNSKEPRLSVDDGKSMDVISEEIIVLPADGNYPIGSQTLPSAARPHCDDYNSSRGSSSVLYALSAVLALGYVLLLVTAVAVITWLRRQRRAAANTSG